MRSSHLFAVIFLCGIISLVTADHTGACTHRCRCCKCCKKSLSAVSFLSDIQYAPAVNRKIDDILDQSVETGYTPSERLSPETFLLICDTNEDDGLNLDEFTQCVKNIGKESMADNYLFRTVDDNNDGTLSLTELEHFELDIFGSGDCYEDKVTSCAAQFVMYEKVRGVTRRSLCGGVQLYHDCIKSQKGCPDPRLQTMDRVFSWINRQLLRSCSSEVPFLLSFIQRGTLSCAADLIRALHGPQPPCAAMATFSKCLQAKAKAGKGETLFDNIVKLVKCREEE